MDLNLNLALTNKLVGVKNTSVNVRKSASTTADILINVKKGSYVGRCSGFYIDQTDGRWIEVNLQTPINNIYIGFVRDDVISYHTPADNNVANSNAQDLINSFLKNELEIFKSLVRSANIIISLDQKGVNTTASKQKLKYLIYRLGQRQNLLLNSGLAKSYKTGYPKKYAKLIEGYKSIVESITGIGVIPIIIIIIVFAIGAASAVACYYAFRPRYDESKVDLKVCKDLEDALSKMDPVKANKIKESLETQIDDAYNAGKTSGKFDGMFTFVKPVAFALGGFYLITKFIDHQTTKRKS